MPLTGYPLCFCFLFYLFILSRASQFERFIANIYHRIRHALTKLSSNQFIYSILQNSFCYFCIFYAKTYGSIIRI